MGDTPNSTNATLSSSHKNASEASARVAGPLAAGIGLLLIISALLTILAVWGFRNRRKRVYHVSDKILKKGIAAKKQVTESQTAVQNDFAEDEPVQGLNYEQSTDHLVSTAEIDYTAFVSSRTSIPQTNTNELPGASKSVVSSKTEDSQYQGPSNNQAVNKQETSEEHFIPRANPLLLHLKKSNKIASLVEDSSVNSSITSGSTEITDEELILIGTAIKSCPNFGRESPTGYEHDQDEPCETLSYPALTQTDETTQAKTSTSFQLQEVSSASEISLAADNFYQLSAENLDDIPCTEAVAVNHKDLWASQDVVSNDVIIIDN